MMSKYLGKRIFFLSGLILNYCPMLFYRKVTILMVGLDNAGKTSTVADLTGGSFSVTFFFLLISLHCF